jgi:putative DNA primase/helicase
MSRVFGDYATQISPAVVSHNGFSRQDNTYNDQLARVKNARIVTTSELEKGAFLAEATVKQLTGGERIVARPLRERSREFMPKEVILIICQLLLVQTTVFGGGSCQFR